MSRKRAAEGPLFSDDIGARHANLMQDYLQLQDEFVATKDRLQAAKARKATLLAEVRFLRRRLKKLKEIPSDFKGNETASAISQRDSLVAPSGKTHLQAVMPEPSSRSSMDNSVPVFWEPMGRKGSNEFAKPKPVNENFGLISAFAKPKLVNENVGLISAFAKPKPVNENVRLVSAFAKPKPVNENVGLVSALKSSAFQKKSNGFVTVMAGKRKISWQDQISLECS